MNKKKISIIVCAYNGEEYIDRCVKTIVNQTLGIEQLEIILVNDASTDGTLEKFKYWEGKYPGDIVVITYEENKRLGGARNTGLQYASGEYVGYVDCDDWIELTMYEKMYQKAVEYDCDVVRCKYSRDVDEGQWNSAGKKGKDKFYDSSQFTEKYPFWERTLEVGENGYYGSCWSGIYRRELLLKHNIHFPENLYYEDNFWGELLNLYIKRMYIIDEVLYHYYVNDESISMARNSIKHLERLEIELLILEELEKRGVYQEYREIVERNFIVRFYLNTMNILFTRFDNIPDVFPIMRETVLEKFPNYRKNKYLNEIINPMGNVLLKLLETKQVPSVKDLEAIKDKYVEVL
ncbi:MAG: glycosyltransferase [Lachnospiraceae bacterium]|nr:glycosyltransferase [Lachnospiraceae bacterium]